MAIREWLTLEQFLRLPEAEPALEYWKGAIAQKVSPKLRHGRLQLVVAQFLNSAGEPNKLGLAFPEARCTFAGASVVPDVAFFTWDRLPLDDRGELANDVYEPPDISVEITSPGQSVSELVERCRWYVEHGVRIALLVHERTRTVRTFRPNAPMRILRGSDPIDLREVLPDFRLTVDALFAALRP